MELKVGKQMAEYQLVFFQPYPEDGERLCIGILFAEIGNVRSLAYDASFARVRCFAPNFEVDLLRFLMRSLESHLSNPELSMEQVLASLGSQLSLSAARLVVSPVSDAIKVRLLERFVIRRERAAAGLSIAAASEKAVPDNRFSKHLLRFTTPLLGGPNLSFIENADSKQVLGRKVAGVGPVSLLIKSENQLTVLDGVDLSIQTPNEAVRRTGKVAHTFWQYRRYAEELIIDRKINRVAVIFNGAPQANPKYRDARGFARDILAERSEMMIEHDGAEDLSRLESLVHQ